MDYKIELSRWRKGEKLKCPKCRKKVGAPYLCECGAILKPFVKHIF